MTEDVLIPAGRGEVPPVKAASGAMGRSARRLACAAIGASLLAACLPGCRDWTWPPGGPTTGPTTGPAAAIPGVPAFAEVSPALYRGGQPTAEGFANLRRAGVRTVVSLRTLGTDRFDMRGTDLRYLRLSFKHVHPEDEDVLAFLKVAEDPANQPVFIHCRDGRDRTGMMVAVYRVIVQGWSKADALAEMQRLGFDHFWDLLEGYVEDMDVAAMKASLRTMPPPPLDVAN